MSSILRSRAPTCSIRPTSLTWPRSARPVSRDHRSSGTAELAGGGEDDIEFWTTPTTLKVLHLRRNPAIAVSIHDEANPYRYTELRGRATLTPVRGHQLLDELTPLYWKQDSYPEGDDDLSEGVVIRVETTHRVVYGE